MWTKSGFSDISKDRISQEQNLQTTSPVCWRRLKISSESIGEDEEGLLFSSGEPLLQYKRSRSNASITLWWVSLVLWPLNAKSRAILPFRRRSLYSCRSTAENCGVSSSTFKPNRQRISLGRRRQIELSRRRRFLKSTCGLHLDEWVTSLMYFRKIAGSCRIGTPRKETSAERSVKEFWMGVPVKHHRIWEGILLTARNCLVDKFRITCAGTKLFDANVLLGHYL